MASKNLTIMIISHNEIEHTKLTIKSIRLFADTENTSVILVDNCSTDGLREWAFTQPDLTCVYIDEGKLPYGQVINKVKSALNINGDLLVMDGHFMLTPCCLSRMQDTLYESENIGAVGSMANNWFNQQKVTTANDFSEIVSLAEITSPMPGKQVMSLYAGAILFKETALLELGEFDELLEENYTISDYCFRMILSDWVMKVCPCSFLWDLSTQDYYPRPNSPDRQIIEQKWGMHYFNSMYSKHVIEMIKENSASAFSVLEIGCDCGATLLEIKNRYPQATVYGSEINEKAALVASHFATVSVNNIEELNLEYNVHMFDYIIFGDVLEHLRNPLKVVQYCKTLLKPDGRILASIPNLMHISVMEQLLNGNFTYTETGLLDKTHIHLFTFNEIKRLFQDAGYALEDISTIIYPLSGEQSLLIDNLVNLNSNAQRFMYETFQYVVCAQAMNN